MKNLSLKSEKKLYCLIDSDMYDNRRIKNKTISKCRMSFVLSGCLSQGLTIVNIVMSLEIFKIYIYM